MGGTTHREEWSDVAVRPTAVLSQEDKSKRVPAADLLPIINVSQKANNFCTEYHSKPEKILCIRNTKKIRRGQCPQDKQAENTIHCNVVLSTIMRKEIDNT